MHAIESVATKLKEAQIAYVVESLSQVSAEVPLPVLFRGKDLDFDADLLNIKLVGEADEDDTKVLSCAHFCSQNISAPAIFSAEVRNSL